MEPAWSPSGRRLAYSALVDVSHRDIFTRPADGGAATPVTSDAFVDWGPAWSHDGRHLFFAAIAAAARTSGASASMRKPAACSASRSRSPLPRRP